MLETNLKKYIFNKHKQALLSKVLPFEVQKEYYSIKMRKKEKRKVSKTNCLINGFQNTNKQHPDSQASYLIIM